MVDRREVAGRDESGTLRSVVDGLLAHGGKPALVAVRDEGVEIWTYGELAGRVLGLGRGLRGAGVNRGDHVALFAANSGEWVAACLAVISAGAVVVPLDAQFGDEAIRARASRAWPSGLWCSDAVRTWSGSPKVNVHPREACSRSSRA